jgi:hypothetical protein
MSLTKCVHTMKRLCLLVTLVLGSPLHAQTVSLICEHMSGAFQGVTLGITVSFSNRTVEEAEGTWPSEITNQHIMWTRRYANGHAQSLRIDRITGAWESWTNGGWQSNFGYPGIVCRKATKVID